MTLIMSVRGIRKEFADRTVLRDVSFDLAAGDRIGLVGPNGCGKTTLARILTGGLTPEAGQIRRFREMNIGYLEQSTRFSVQAWSESVQESQTGGFLATASHLGLRQVQEWEPERLTGLSGGEQTKLALARVWAANPDVLILDEPTNHLDFDGIQWLAGELQRFAGAVLIISHDRYFLDRSIQRVLELDHGTITEYPGNYTAYRQEKQRRYEEAMHRYAAEKKRQDLLEEEIARLKGWSATAHRESRKKAAQSGNLFGGKEYHRAKAKRMDKQVKSRIKRLEKMRTTGEAKPIKETEVFFRFGEAAAAGRRVAEARDLGKGYGSTILFSDSSFFIQRGDRVGLVGPNGCGKTTLLRMMLGVENPDCGDLWISPSARVAYLSQDVLDLDEHRSALAILSAFSPEMRARARTVLANMGFDADMVAKPVGALSLGERTRLKIALLLLEENGLLILDEPTNHLDLFSREQLERTLLEYNGTLLLVSHDRYMIDKVCDKLLVFADGRIRMCATGMEQETGVPEGERETLENRMAVENRLAVVLGELSRHKPGDPEYRELDGEFQELVRLKKALS